MQFRPLLSAGCAPTNDLDAPIVTWDLANPITRKDDDLTPRSMQLDFLFVHQPSAEVERQQAEAGAGGGADGAGRPRCCTHLKPISTEATRPRSFFVAGSPLSDHYGLSTSFAVAVDA